jgi:CRISPR-associated endonuclease/helicase Cas3
MHVNAIPLAHSASDGCPEQTYPQHVTSVCSDAAAFASEVATYSHKHGADIIASVTLAAAYHDLGKLDTIFQRALKLDLRSTGINHVDAGAAALLSPGHRQVEAALAVYSHHLGLPDVLHETAKCENNIPGLLRDLSDNDILGTQTFLHVDQQLQTYLDEHHRYLQPVATKAKPGFSGLKRRIALSCLVDADHGDTARHYGKELPVSGIPLQSAERLASLDRYVADLQQGKPTEPAQAARQALRQQFYQACRDRSLKTDQTIVACDSPVGTGKTTAVMAHLLNIAAQRGLRRIIVVLPFTNIIDQAVEVYRKALVLPGENAEEIVAAHHHRVEFTGDNALSLRLLTQRWEAPIIITTAVQFFETLAASSTSALRKLHRLVGAGIFVDETHAAMRAPLWPQMFRWLAELGQHWSCHTVLASGSLARFWEMPDFFPADKPSPASVTELVEDTDLKARARTLEQARVKLATHSRPLSFNAIAELVMSAPGPRLIIFNTVQSAAVFAEFLAKTANVEHLSTALTPHDRAITLARVIGRLKVMSDFDWTLVATSCVEAGVDLSFRSAFRESCGLVNLIQISGRVNRHNEHAHTESTVWDFRHDGANLLNLHPDFEITRRVLADMFCDGQAEASTEACSEALRRELICDFGKGSAKVEKIRQLEVKGQYPQVAKECRLITSDTRLVVICKELIKTLEEVHPSQWPGIKHIMQKSVQIWATKLDPKKWPVKPLDDELWSWVGEYNSFIGYMAGVLPLLRSQREGFDTL